MLAEAGPKKHHQMQKMYKRFVVWEKSGAKAKNPSQGPDDTITPPKVTPSRQKKNAAGAVSASPTITGQARPGPSGEGGGNRVRQTEGSQTKKCGDGRVNPPSQRQNWDSSSRKRVPKAGSNRQTHNKVGLARTGRDRRAPLANRHYRGHERVEVKEHRRRCEPEIQTHRQWGYTRIRSQWRIVMN